MKMNRRQFVVQSAAALAALSTLKMNALAKAMEETGIKDLFKDDFYLGTAIGKSKFMGENPEFFDLVAREFNAITMENEMKWERVHPKEGQWDWEVPDKFMAFGEKYGMYIVGHVLVWHSQVPDWVFTDDKGKALSRRKLLKRMEDHIETIGGRYQKQVNAWDVVNEAIDEGNGWRKSKWFNTIGPKFMDYAFNYAHEAAPKAQLLYNDYNMQNPKKREFLVDYIKKAKKRGVPISAVGLQGHVGLNFPDIKEFEDSIIAYADAGMRVHVTELDMDVLPVAWEFMGAEISTNFEYSDKLNPWPNGLPAEIEKKVSDRYAEYFKLFLKHRDKIERITFWGTGDAESWKNDFPVKGRTNYPLLFDREYKKKPCYHAIAALKK